MVLTSRVIAGSLGVALIFWAGATSCAGHEHARALDEARVDMTEVIALIESGDMPEARLRFAEADGPLHETAALVEPVNPETAEVVNDITEFLKERMATEPADPAALLDTAGRVLAWLETAHMDLGG